MSGRYESEMKIDGKLRRKMVGMPTVLEEYYDSLIGAGKSYRTAQTYIENVIQFIKFNGDYREDFYEDIKPSHINKYIASTRTKTVNGKIKNTSDSHKTQHWSALNSFFQFLVPEYLDSNPVASTRRPKMKDKPNVTFLTPDEISIMFDNVEKLAQEKMKNRDLCIMKLGFAVGLRGSAIVHIDIEDLDLEHNQIRVTEKGDEDYCVMIGENLKHQILLWLQDRKKYFSESDSDALFLSQQGNRFTVRSLTDIIGKYTNGIDKHITPHVMRHSCATNLYEKTGDIYLCASQLHHKNVTTTQRYAELSRAKQQKATNILDSII